MYRSLYRIAHPLAKTAASMTSEEFDAIMRGKNHRLHFGKDGTKFVDKRDGSEKIIHARKKSLYEQVKAHSETVKWLKDRGVNIEDFSPENEEKRRKKILSGVRADNEVAKKLRPGADKNTGKMFSDRPVRPHKDAQKISDISTEIKPGRPWMRGLGIGLAASGLVGLGLAAYKSSRRYKNRDHRA